MRAFTESHTGWLTVSQLPAYAPDLNPAELFGRHEQCLGNLAACDISQLAAIVKNRLKRIQYQSGLIGGFLAQIVLTFETQPP